MDKDLLRHYASIVLEEIAEITNITDIKWKKKDIALKNKDIGYKNAIVGSHAHTLLELLYFNASSIYHLLREKTKDKSGLVKKNKGILVTTKFPAIKFVYMDLVDTCNVQDVKLLDLINSMDRTKEFLLFDSIDKVVYFVLQDYRKSHSQNLGNRKMTKSNVLMIPSYKDGTFFTLCDISKFIKPPLKCVRTGTKVYKKIILKDEILCMHCNDPIINKEVVNCSNCKHINYCSVKCQRKEWYKHKYKCDIYKKYIKSKDVCIK